MDPRRPDLRPGAMTDLEAKLLAAGVAGKLFKRQQDPVQLGRYRLIERLGQGGMGVVFRANDPQLRRDVAVKLLHARVGVGAEQHARLRREALALGRLSHPNVVQVFEVGETEQHMFVVMELVRGVTLRAWLGERARTVAEVVGLAGQVGRGLAAAHAAGIVHRDLKPENVLVGLDGRARVVDFGLARAAASGLGDGASSLELPLTRTGMLLGTPAFMAPEQVRDPTHADARSDQFSLCVLVYEALYGERPFVDAAAAEAGELRAAPVTTSASAALRAVVVRGLQRDPAARWGSVETFVAALEAAATSVQRPRRRGWIAGLVVVIGVAGALGFLLGRRDAGSFVGRSGMGAAVSRAVMRGAAPRWVSSGVASEVPRRFQAGRWLALEPALVRRDPDGRGLVIDGAEAEQTLVAWPLVDVRARVIVEALVEPRCLAHGASLVLGVDVGSLALVAADGWLQLRCGGETAAIGALARDGSYAPIALRLVVDEHSIVCSAGRTELRAGRTAGQVARIELRARAGGDPACARTSVGRIAVRGADVAGARELAPIERAAAALVDDEPDAVTRALIGSTEARAPLWRAIAAARRGQDMALAGVLGEPGVERELSRWLRGDPRVLGPALRRTLGDAAYGTLFATTWLASPDAEAWSPSVVQAVLAETGALVDRCDGAACASLLRARGRALLQIGDRSGAQRALGAALAVVPADAEGRALASRILVDLTLVKTERD